MRISVALAAGLIASALVGCGTQVGTVTGPKPGGTGHKVPVTPSACVHLRPTPGDRSVSLTNADNHKSFCVARGTGVFVFLHSATSHLWTPIQSSSSALSRRPSGVMSLARGVTGAYYVAAGLGRATLTSAVSRCPKGPHPSAGGRCPAPILYSVTVYVQA